MIEADYNSGSSVLNYGYDVAGNMVNYDGVTRTYNAANQMTNDGTNTLTYDNNGNLTGNGTDTYTWDRANRLLSVGNHSYVYDGLGNRVQQTVSSVVTNHLNDVQPGLTKLLAQSTGTNVDRFVHAPRGIHAVDDGSEWNFYANDGLGSVRAVVDDMAVVQSSMSFDPYGMPLGTNPDNFGFTGEQTDANGLNYRRARYYDPTLGIWTAEDLLETPNRYAYVGGNPTNFVDMNGLQGINSDTIDSTGGNRPVLTPPTGSAYVEAGFAFGLATLGSGLSTTYEAAANTIAQMQENLVTAQTNLITTVATIPMVAQVSIQSLEELISPSTGTIAANPPVAQPPSFDPEKLWRDVQDICTVGLAVVVK